MKKTATMMICILCLITLIRQGAFAEQVTLSELKKQTSARLKMTVINEDGKTIEVDAPIVMPIGGAMPVLLVTRAAFNLASLYESFPHPSFYGQVQKEASRYWAFDGSPTMHLYGEEKEYLISGRADSTTRASLPQGETPPENPVTVDEIMTFINRNIEFFSCNTQPDMRVLRATALTGLYAMKKAKGVPGYVINLEKPIENAAKGIWELDIAQFMHGVQLFEHYWPDGAFYPSPDIALNWYSPFWCRATYMDDRNFNIIISPAKEMNVLIEEAPLLPFEAVVAIIKERVESGKLRYIDNITLGYSVKIVKGDAFLDENYEHSLSTGYVLVPEWKIVGFDEKNERAANSVGIVEPSADTPFDEAVYKHYGMSCDIRMDASTGLFVLDHEAMQYAPEQ